MGSSQKAAFLLAGWGHTYCSVKRNREAQTWKEHFPITLAEARSLATPARDGRTPGEFELFVLQLRRIAAARAQKSPSTADRPLAGTLVLLYKRRIRRKPWIGSYSTGTIMRSTAIFLSVLYALFFVGGAAGEAPRIPPQRGRPNSSRRRSRPKRKSHSGSTRPRPKLPGLRAATSRARAEASR